MYNNKDAASAVYTHVRTATNEATEQLNDSRY